MDSKYTEIVKKVKGLLAIANDRKNDEESQSAFLLAQKLMLKYNVSKEDVSDSEIVEEINEESVTIFKKMFWWERKLATIIGDNFRVKVFYRSKILDGNKNRTSKIMFYGFERDLEMAKEMYLLAYEVMLFHSKQYIDYHYKQTEKKRTRYVTESVKVSYINGFLEGLNERFKEQVHALKKEFDLMVLIPKEVEDSYKSMSTDFGVYKTVSPPIEVTAAFKDGLRKGKEIDFTQSTVDTTDYSSIYGKIIKFNQGASKGLLGKIIKIEDKEMKLLVCYDRNSGFSPSFYTWELPFDYPFEFADDVVAAQFELNYQKSKDE